MVGFVLEHNLSVGPLIEKSKCLCRLAKTIIHTDLSHSLFYHTKEGEICDEVESKKVEILFWGKLYFKKVRLVGLNFTTWYFYIHLTPTAIASHLAISLLFCTYLL